MKLTPQCPYLKVVYDFFPAEKRPLSAENTKGNCGIREQGQVAGDRRQEAGSREQGAGGREQGTGGRKQEADGRKQVEGGRKKRAASFKKVGSSKDNEFHWSRNEKKTI
ncbi:MAG: hypothetical protein IPP73_17280 [Chitinophagaceae bacterium]|nr:hypothetical protein [Chitinophagaceae bacterium]